MAHGDTPAIYPGHIEAVRMDILSEMEMRLQRLEIILNCPASKIFI